MATVDYFINLAGNAVQMAERFVKAFANVQESAVAMGGGVEAAEKAISTLGGTMGRIADNAARATQGIGAFTQANSRAAQEAARANELWFKQANEVEKRYNSQLMSREANKQLREDRPDLFPTRESGGLGFMGGLFALSMLHNDVLKSWEGFDEEIRRIRGTAAGQLSDSDIQELRASALKTAQGTIFTGADIAKIMLAEVERGVPVNQRTKNGDLLGAVIAKQMLGIATGTGEDPADTFKTHLAIQRGFELPFEAFPHISDTIARIHQKTGISLKQIETQMGQIASYAHASGWTEEQTVGAVGYLAKRGMGQYAGSGLARLISKSQAWSKPAAEFWKSLGIEKEDLVDKATGGMIAPDAMMQLLQDHTKGMRQADVAAAFSKMFGDRGVKIASALLGGDPAELRQMIIDLQDVDGLAEKMGVEGSKGGVAGLKKFSAAWENLKQSVGESGFGEHVGWLAGKFGDLFDAVAGGPKGGAEAVGWMAQGINVLSAAAMPLIALPAIGQIVAWIGRVTGLSAAFRLLGGAISSVAGMGASGLLQFSSGIGALVARSIGLSGVASSLTLVGTAARLLLGLTGITAALVIGYEVVTHWQQIAAAIERTAKALKELAHGNTQPLKDIGTDVGKAIGIDKPKLPEGFHGGRWGHWDPGKGPMVGSSAIGATAPLRVDSRVKVDPIQIHIPSSITVNVAGPGLSGTGSIPLSSSAPRGQALPEGDQHH